MRLLAMAAIIASCILTGACDQLGRPFAETTCSSPDALNVTQSLISDQIQKNAIEGAKSAANNADPIPESNIRAAVNLLKVSVSDVRTTKVDPNSTKRFCSAQAKVVVPLNVVQDADRVRSLSNSPSVNAVADAAGIQRGADAFTFPIDYDVQPTDDRKEVYAESDSIGNQSAFFGALVLDYVSKPRIEAAMLAFQQQQQAQAQAQQALQQQAFQSALDDAKAENALSVQSINATWTSIDPNVRTQLIDAERAWIKQKSDDCKIQAASTSVDPTEIETARLKCDTLANQQRQAWLRQYLSDPAG